MPDRTLCSVCALQNMEEKGNEIRCDIYIDGKPFCAACARKHLEERFPGTLVSFSFGGDSVERELWVVRGKDNIVTKEVGALDGNCFVARSNRHYIFGTDAFKTKKEAIECAIAKESSWLETSTKEQSRWRFVEDRARKRIVSLQRELNEIAEGEA